LPEAGDVGRLRMVAWLIERAVKFDDIDTDPVRRLAALLKPGLTTDTIKALSERLKFSNLERKHLLAMTAPAPIINVDMSDKELRIACAEAGAKIVVDRALLSWAGELAMKAHLPSPRTESWRHLVETARDCHIAPLPIKGRDVLEMGVAHGPEVGRLLKQIETWWRELDFRPDRDACLEKLKHLLKTHP